MRSNLAQERPSLPRTPCQFGSSAQLTDRGGPTSHGGATAFVFIETTSWTQKLSKAALGMMLSEAEVEFNPEEGINMLRAKVRELIRRDGDKDLMKAGIVGTCE
ncbi:uncharacterized protein LOC134533747 [Bacillus rossius redtenbacheri]|uniref:uncharacterized protein LOC134533747 n=1 Tax=Bacillus rossius redtenbacheri TaxID=93214 RepID=UPI002FDCCEB9